MFPICIALCSLLLALSCESEASRQRAASAVRAEARRADSAALKVAVLPTVDCLPIVVADSLHLFDSLGVDVRLRPKHAFCDCRHALARRTVEVAVLDSALLAAMNAAEPDAFSARMPLNGTLTVFTSRKSRITRAEGLADKIVAADREGMSHEVAVQTAPKAFHVQVEDLAIRLDMLRTGNVDAAVLPQPFADRARRLGAKQIATPRQARTVLAVRSKVMADTARQRQWQAFAKALAIAQDSIKRYTPQHYIHYLDAK